MAANNIRRTFRRPPVAKGKLQTQVARSEVAGGSFPFCETEVK